MCHMITLFIFFFWKRRNIIEKNTMSKLIIIKYYAIDFKCETFLRIKCLPFTNKQIVRVKKYIVALTKYLDSRKSYENLMIQYKVEFIIKTGERNIDRYLKGIVNEILCD